jgi:hypothetical protein
MGGRCWRKAMLTSVTHWIGWATRPFIPAHYSPLAHERRRLSILGLICFFKLFDFFGINWDIQWHLAIGRDSLFIPPHLVVAVSFVAGLTLSLGAVTYETWLDRRGVQLAGVMRWGGVTAAPAFLAVALGYLAVSFVTFTDELWHRAFGLDATLWSPPHLAGMLAMNGIYFSLLMGLTATARRLGQPLSPRTPYFWVFILAGAFTLESANFQLSEALIVGHRQGGAGLWGLLFPLVTGVWYALALAFIVRLAGRFWIGLPILALTLGLQFVSTGLAALGFAVLQPVSVIEAFVRDNPDSVIALAREFTIRNGFSNLVGLQLAWLIGLSTAPLALVALLDRWPAARTRPWVAGPVYAAALVLACVVLFRGVPVMAAYDLHAGHVAAALTLALTGGWGMARVGVRLATAADRW